MPFTLAGWSQLVDAATLTAHDALVDPHVRATGKDVYVPSLLPNLAGAYAVGTHITLAQIASPSLRRKANIDIIPVERAGAPLSPPRFYDLFTKPHPLDAGEALNFLAAEDATGTGRQSGFVWLSDGPAVPVTGEIFTVRFTGTTTLTAYTWTTVPLTPTQSLPAGRYQIVGMSAISTGAIAARLIIPGYTWRPGVIGATAVSSFGHERFRWGNAGVFGEFPHDLPPTAEFFSASADTSETVFLDLIKIA